MLKVSQLAKSFGVEPVFQGVSFTLNRGERLALVGPNGCGKTTLLRILTGEEQPTAGAVQFGAPDLRVGYLPQGLKPEEGDTLGGFLTADVGELAELTVEVEQLAMSLAGPDSAAHAASYDRALERLVRADRAAARMPAVLGALGLDGFALDAPVSVLSGGQKTRLALARVLLGDPQLLLLDEPTNHLDLEMLEWLEDWLNEFQGAALVVSHDRAFLDHIATTILELDPQTLTARLYPGNYADYLEAKLAERQRQWQVYQDQQEEMDRLRAAIAHVRSIARFRKGGKADTNDKFAKGFFANRGKGTIRKATQLEERLHVMQTEERVDRPRSSWQMKLEFGDGSASSRRVLSLEDLTVGYGQRALLRELNQTVMYGARIALIGPNGSGKTTLLRTIAGRLQPLAGQARLGANVRLGYMTQEQEELSPDMDAFQTLRRLSSWSDTEIRSFLHKFLFSGDDVFTPVRLLSYGERARLNLACLTASGCTFLLLDEPINHLDIPARARFEQALAAFEGTVLAVVHDRYFIQSFASEIWQVQGEGLAVWPTQPLG